MADRIKVSFGALDNAVSDLQSGANAMNARMDQLRSDIAPMLGTWDGAARESYFAAQQKWDTGWQELQAALQQMRGATQTSHQNYQSGETSNAGLFSA